MIYHQTVQPLLCQGDSRKWIRNPTSINKSSDHESSIGMGYVFIRKVTWDTFVFVYRSRNNIAMLVFQNQLQH